MHKPNKPQIKLKFLINKKYNLAGIILGIAAIFTSLVPQARVAAASQPAASYATLSNPGNFSGLPVSGVKSYPAAKAEGTVILLPQYHRDPSSTSVNDPANDSGVKNQQQSVEILKRLAERDHVSLIMVEGDLQGEVPQSKVDHLNQEIAARDQFVLSYKALKQEASQSKVDPKMTQQLYSQLDQELENVNRDIALQGAPYILKAQGENVTLVGAEKQQTLDAAATVVRDYVYINDRMAQVKQTSGVLQPNVVAAGAGGGNMQQLIQQMMSGKGAMGSDNMQQMLQQLMGGKGALKNSNSFVMPQPKMGTKNTSGGNSLKQMLTQNQSAGSSLAGGNFLQILQQLMGNKKSMPSGAAGGNSIQQMIQQLTGQMGGAQGSPTASLTQLKTYAQSQSDSQLTSALTNMERSSQNLQTSSQTFVQPAAATTAPSRANNPYANISDLGKLQDLASKNEQQVNAVVIGQRNQEAASGLAQAMKTHNQNVSVLQFGAGHEDGLVKELNKQNLNVVVITTDEVAARAGQKK